MNKLSIYTRALENKEKIIQTAREVQEWKEPVRRSDKWKRWRFIMWCAIVSRKVWYDILWDYLQRDKDVDSMRDDVGKKREIEDNYKKAWSDNKVRETLHTIYYDYKIVNKYSLSWWDKILILGIPYTDVNTRNNEEKYAYSVQVSEKVHPETYKRCEQSFSEAWSFLP